MSPDPIPTPGQPAGTGQAPTPPTAEQAGTEGGGQDGAGKYLTRAEADALENRVRSYVDKSRVKVQSAAQEVISSVAKLRELGQEVSPEAEKKLIEAAKMKAMDEPDLPVNTSGQLPPQAGDQTVALDPEIATIQRNVGVELYDGDPELAKLDRSKGYLEFMKSVEAAAIAKKSRLALQPDQSNPASRSAPLGNPPSGLTPEMPAREAWQRVEHKK